MKSYLLAAKRSTKSQVPSRNCPELSAELHINVSSSLDEEHIKKVLIIGIFVVSTRVISKGVEGFGFQLRLHMLALFSKLQPYAPGPIEDKQPGRLSQA